VLSISRFAGSNTRKGETPKPDVVDAILKECNTTYYDIGAKVKLYRQFDPIGSSILL